MAEIAIWGLAGLLAVLSTLPIFILQAGGSEVRGLRFAWSVALLGVSVAGFILYASAKQAGAFDPAPTVEAPGPNSLPNPFLEQ